MSSMALASQGAQILKDVFVKDILLITCDLQQFLISTCQENKNNTRNLNTKQKLVEEMFDFLEGQNDDGN